jgi:hypothetical protein
MNAYKKNQFLKYQILSEYEETDKQPQIDDTPSNPIVEPVTALIEYVKDKYDVDVTDEVKYYETRLKSIVMIKKED